MIKGVEILFEQGKTGGIQGYFIQLQDGYGHPEQGLVDGRLGSEEGLQPGQTHHYGVDQHDVRETFKGLKRDGYISFFTMKDLPNTYLLKPSMIQMIQKYIP